MANPAHGESDHEVFGLRLRAGLALPELWPARGAGVPDVIVGIGEVPELLPGGVIVDPGLQVLPDDVLLSAPAGRYRITGGRRITIAPRPAAPEPDVRLFLLGTALGALCHQRPGLPLHAAAVLTLTGAVAFAGPTGAGKSTLAAQLAARGALVLAEDLCVADTSGFGAPRVRPGLSRIKLWRGSPALDPARASTLQPIGESIDKFSLPVDGPVPQEGAPLRRIYVLAPGGGAGSVRRLSGAEAAQAVIDSIYRWPLAIAMGRAAPRFAQAAMLARAVEIVEIGHPHGPADPGRLADHLTRTLDL